MIITYNLKRFLHTEYLLIMAKSILGFAIVSLYYPKPFEYLFNSTWMALIVVLYVRDA